MSHLRYTNWQSIDQDDDLILDAPEITAIDVLVPIVDGDSAMHIDEEGRPRFAPAKNTVRSDTSQYLT